MLVRFLELTGTNNGSQLGFLQKLIEFFPNVDFFRNVIVAIFTVSLLVVVVAGSLLLLHTYTAARQIMAISPTSNMHR